MTDDAEPRGLYAAGERGFRFSKALGQNFLTDAGIARKIPLAAGIDRSFGVLEIGPGAGALTVPLAGAAARVLAVELDGRLIPALRQTVSEYGNVEIIHGDILKLNLRELIPEKLGGLRRAVCANLPYGITTPAIAALLECEQFESVTVMTQREVARRICAAPGAPECGAFSIFCQYYADCSIAFDVSPGAFYPRPSVRSSVVVMRLLDARAAAPGDEALFFRVVRAAFGQRRKTLINALRAGFGPRLTRESLASALSELGYGPMTRGEDISVAGFAAISARLSKIISQ